MKLITITVINDLVTDQRLHRMAATLVREGYSVEAIGRKLRGSLPIENAPFRIRRILMLFSKGPLFYAFYNLRLFILLLLKRKPDLLVSYDLDTLLPNFLVSRIRKIPLLYDSHEYFTEVPELVHRPQVKKVWEWLEGMIVPRLKHAITVSESVSRVFNEKYGIEFVTIRNVPFKREYAKRTEDVKQVGQNYRIIYQGSVNLARGVDLMIRSIGYLENVTLDVVGDGDLIEDMKLLVEELGIENKVTFKGKIPPNELVWLTGNYDLGLSLEEDFGLNYRFALPNKLFDYIQARIPVLCSDLPEMAALVKEYDIGEVCKVREPGSLSRQILKMLGDETLRTQWRKNLDKAANELCWENEEKKLIGLVNRAMA